MSRHPLYRSGTLQPVKLGDVLRQLRDQSGKPGWEVAAAAQTDASVLSKIELGKRLPTPAQLAALAKFFGVPLAPLESRRLAQEMLGYYGSHPQLAEATAILREEACEYRVKKKPIPANNPPKAVNNSKKNR